MPVLSLHPKCENKPCDSRADDPTDRSGALRANCRLGFYKFSLQDIGGCYISEFVKLVLMKFCPNVKFGFLVADGGVQGLLA